MCRLLAVTSNLETDLKFSFKRLCEIAKANSHKHGWGIAWMKKDKLVVEKDENPIWESEKARSLIRNIRSKLIIVHARRNPSQMPSKIRSHPFLHTSLNTHWVFAHNGTVRCPKPIYHKPQSDVDSERFFCYFLDTLQEVSKHGQFNKRRTCFRSIKKEP